MFVCVCVPLGPAHSILVEKPRDVLLLCSEGILHSVATSARGHVPSGAIP